MAMTFSLPNMVKLNGVNLTDESRSPVAITLDNRVIDKQLASGKNVRFVVGTCSKFSISWDNVGSSASKTVDGFGGRDEIKVLSYYNQPIELVLEYLNGSKDTYTVLVDSYTENIALRRRGELRYNISIELTEQG